MLAKSHRLNREEFQFFFDKTKQIKVFKFDFGNISLLPILGSTKIGIVLSKKTIPKKVDRSYIRRIYYTSFKKYINTYKDYYLFFKINKPAKSLIEAEKQINLIYSIIFNNEKN